MRHTRGKYWRPGEEIEMLCAEPKADTYRMLRSSVAQGGVGSVRRDARRNTKEHEDRRGGSGLAEEPGHPQPQHRDQLAQLPCRRLPQIDQIAAWFRRRPHPIKTRARPPDGRVDLSEQP